MGRNRATAGYAWGVLAGKSAADAGFEPVGSLLEGEVFRLSGDIAPWVQVFFQRVTNTETAPAAILGVYAAEFEREWRDRLRQAALSGVGEFPPLGLHAMNVKQLRERPWSPNSPSDHDIASVQDWLGRVFDYAKRRLPSGVPALVSAFDAGRIADHSVEAYLGHPVKVRGLVGWLRRARGIDVGERVLPLLGGRTEPYDVSAMLGPPLS